MRPSYLVLGSLQQQSWAADLSCCGSTLVLYVVSSRFLSLLSYVPVESPRLYNKNTRPTVGHLRPPLLLWVLFFFCQNVFTIILLTRFTAPHETKPYYHYSNSGRSINFNYIRSRCDAPLQKNYKFLFLLTHLRPSPDLFWYKRHNNASKARCRRPWLGGRV